MLQVGAREGQVGSQDSHHYPTRPIPPAVSVDGGHMKNSKRYSYPAQSRDQWGLSGEHSSYHYPAVMRNNPISGVNRGQEESVEVYSFLVVIRQCSFLLPLPDPYHRQLKLRLKYDPESHNIIP